MLLGTKSAFSYTKSFHFVCRKEGIERKYLLYKSELGFNIDLLFEKPTNEKDGVMVIIPVISGDYWRFLSAIKNQLCYFDNVFFDIQGQDLNKDFKIYVEDDCQRSTLRSDKEMHICLGRVCYPIDWKVLGINRINLPIGLKFNLDSGIFPTPNRESIIWSKDTCRLIKDRITKVAKLLIKKYNDSVKEFDNLYEAYSFIDKSSKYITFLGEDMDIRELYSYGSFNDPKIKGISIKTSSFYKRLISYMCDDYKFSGQIINNTISTRRIRYTDFSSSYIIERKEKIGIINSTDKLTGYFSSFIKTKNFKYLIREKPSFEKTQKDEEYYEQILGQNYSTSLLVEYLAVKDAYIKAAFIDARDLYTSQEFEDYKKANKVVKKALYISKKVNKQHGDVVINESYKIKNRSGYAFSKKSINIDKIASLPYQLILIEDDDIFEESYHSIFSEQKIKFFKIGKQDYKKLSKVKIHNIMKFKDLERTKAYARIVSVLYIDELLDSFNTIEKGNIIPILDAAFPKFEKLCTELDVYKRKNYQYVSINDNIIKGIISVAKQHNYFDPLVIDKIKELEKFVEDFKFISYLRKPSSPSEADEYMELVYSLLIMRKSKFNKGNNIEIKIKN